MIFEPMDRDPGVGKPEYHDTSTISLGELYDCGVFSPQEDAWKWNSYSAEQYDRVCEKIVNRYWDREIGILPILSWRRRYVSKMNEIMPKYKMLYKILDEGFDPLVVNDLHKKGRNVFSDFPQTSIGGANEDYASNGTDFENEEITYGDALKRVLDFDYNYKDIDVMILDEIEIVFSCVYSMNLNGQ